MSNNELKDYTEALLYKFDKNKYSDRDLMTYFWEPFGFQEFLIHDFKRLGSPLQLKLRKYLRCGEVYVPSGDLSQALYSLTQEEDLHYWTQENIEECKSDLEEGPITSFWITLDKNNHPPPKAPVFASFCQEPIPLHEQYKELPKERQKQAQNQLKRQPTNHLAKKAPRYPPQPSDCRHCQEHFDSKNALFRYLKLCKTTRLTSRSTSLTRLLSPSLLIRLSTLITSFALLIASIKNVQLQILGQLHAI